MNGGVEDQRRPDPHDPLRDFDVRFVIYFRKRPDRIKLWDFKVPAASYEHAQEKCRRMLANYLEHHSDSIFGAVKDGTSVGSWEWRMWPDRNKMAIYWRQEFWPEPPWTNLENPS
jgi:hypothetical protein